MIEQQIKDKDRFIKGLQVRFNSMRHLKLNDRWISRIV